MSCLYRGQAAQTYAYGPGNETSGENAGLNIFQSALTSHQAQLWLGSYETQSPTLFHRLPVALRSRNSLTVCSEDTEGNQLTLQDTFKSRTLRRASILKPCVECARTLKANFDWL